MGWVLRSNSRVLGLALSAVLLVSACGPKTEIVYIDPRDHDESGHAAHTPIGRSASPRVHKFGVHEPAAEVAIGPADSHAAPYAPISTSHDPRIHAGEKHAAAPAVAIAFERTRTPTDSHAPASGASPGDTSHASSVAAAPAAAPKPQAAPKIAASPTAQARLNLGASLGTAPGTPSAKAPSALEDGPDELETVAGKIESIVGRSVLVETAGGKARVRLAEGSRIDRDALGSPSDLKAGQFVGVLHNPSGPATSIRLYATGPNMPRPGVVPMAGSRVGQITTFGSIVALQFGGLLLNTGGETTTITLPGTVEVLKPATSATADLAAGMSIIATGATNADGTLVASGVRVTGQARADR